MGASRAETGPLRPPPLWTMRQCSAAVCAARSAACPPLEASALASCVVRDSKNFLSTLLCRGHVTAVLGTIRDREATCCSSPSRKRSVLCPSARTYSASAARAETPRRPTTCVGGHPAGAPRHRRGRTAPRTGGPRRNPRPEQQGVSAAPGACGPGSRRDSAKSLAPLLFPGGQACAGWSASPAANRR